MIKTNIYPTVERVIKGKKNLYNRVRQGFYNEEAPYIKDTAEFMKEETLQYPGRFLVISSSEPVAVKAAKFICDYYPTFLDSEEDMEDYEYEIEYDLDEYDEDLNAMDLFDLSKINDTGIIPVNPYLEGLLDESDCDNAMYKGLNNGVDIRKKIDAILMDYRVRKFIWITPEKMNEQWAVDLQMNKGFIPVYISDVPDSYYEEVFNKIMKKRGAKLEKGLTTLAAVSRIRRLRGEDFSEENLDWMVDHALKKPEGKEQGVLSAKDFVLNKFDKESAEDKLKKLPGLNNVKEMVREFTALMLEKARNRKLKGLHSNMIFYGNPGTGKSSCAKLIADIMAEKGVSNPSFIMANRDEIVGKYVGHTAAKVSELFSKARGGILFVDEAGFFLNEGAGGFVQEAIKEFVRFMELYPDVTVIFAMYEKEAEQFLKLDEGIASRISRMVAFKDFTDKELKEIFIHMLKERGYVPGKGAVESAFIYINRIRKESNFGNARDIRKLVTSAITAHSVRIHYGKEDARSKDVITAADVKKGIESLIEKPETQRKFGFDYSRPPVAEVYG